MDWFAAPVGKRARYSRLHTRRILRFGRTVDFCTRRRWRTDRNEFAEPAHLNIIN